MDQQGYQIGLQPWAAAPFQPPVPSPLPTLRPLSTGEVLDRTFVLYRRRFWLFASLGVLPAAVLSVGSIVRVVYLAMTHRVEPLTPLNPAATAANAMGSMVALQAYFLPATILFVVAYGISHAAVVSAVQSLAQGVPVTAANAYRAVRGRWLRWVGIALRQFWSAAWPVLPGMAILLAALFATTRARGNVVLAGALLLLAWLGVLGGVVWGALNFIRKALAMPAGVQEGLGVNRAMRRSRTLVAGRKGRIFLALLLVYALQAVVSGIQLPLLLLASVTRGAQHIILQATQLLVQFVAVTLVSPVASIALALFYVDERVRREGYDIELLMQRSFAPRTAVPEPAATL